MTPPDHDGGIVPRLLTLMGIGGVASGVADTLLSRGPAGVLGALVQSRGWMTTLVILAVRGAGTGTAIFEVDHGAPT